MSTQQDKSNQPPARPTESSTGDALNKELEKWKSEAEREKAIKEQAFHLLRQAQEKEKKTQDMEKAIIAQKICQDWQGISGVRRAVTSPKFSHRLLKRFDNILEQYKSRELDKCRKEMIAEDAAQPFDRQLTVGEYDQERKDWKK